MYVGEIHSLWKILPEQSIGLLIRATLPGALRIAEADLDIGIEGETLVVGHLAAAIPGQRLVKLLR